MVKAEKKVAQKRQKRGVVSSTKMDKTIVVNVDRYVTHKKYKKRFKITKKFYAHDEKGKAGLGDIVVIEEAKPMSKTKKWALKEVLSTN